MKKLAIITTHPIQYNAPWFKLLSEKEGIRVKVFYTWSQRQTEFFDDNFGKEIKWDIPLLDGYDYTFVPNTAKKPGNKSFWGIKCPTLIPRILEYSPTHILIFGWNFHAHFKAMCYFKGKIPVLFRGDSTLLDYNIQSLRDLFKFPIIQILSSSVLQFLKFQARKLFLTFVYRYIDKALYVGTNNKLYFLKHGLKENQLYLVPHAIDNSRFFDGQEKDYTKKAFQWRRELGINDTDFVILFAGKFEPRKNPEILIKAFFKFKETNNNTTKLLMIGNGPLENRLREISKNRPDIIYLPFQNQSDMPIVYRLGNVFCLSSKSETWGLAVNEAMACGRPVLVSDKVGCAVDLINENSGCIFKSGDKRSLFGSLDSIIERETKPDGYNSNVIKSHISNWSYNSIINQIVSQLNE